MHSTPRKCAHACVCAHLQSGGGAGAPSVHARRGMGLSSTSMFIGRSGPLKAATSAAVAKAAVDRQPPPATPGSAAAASAPQDGSTAARAGSGGLAPLQSVGSGGGTGGAVPASTPRGGGGGGGGGTGDGGGDDDGDGTAAALQSPAGRLREAGSLPPGFMRPSKVWAILAGWFGIRCVCLFLGRGGRKAVESWLAARVHAAVKGVGDFGSVQGCSER
eukprot:55096-Chlamydomonas_euryale.AAC.4